MKEKTIFELLNLPSNESEETIKKAFHEFARNNHPDFFPGDKSREEALKRVVLAYDRFKAEQIILKAIRRENIFSRKQKEAYTKFYDKPNSRFHFTA